jgi:hypothetical protein
MQRGATTCNEWEDDDDVNPDAYYGYYFDTEEEYEEWEREWHPEWSELSPSLDSRKTPIPD